MKEPPSETIDNLPFATDSPEDSDAIKEEPYNQPEALGHFELLLEFVDQYLSKQVSLYRRLNSGHGEKIAFQDLWMLFDTGSNIYCPVQEGGIEILNSIEDEASHFTQRRHLPQVYRVAATTGGIPLTKSLASKYQDRSRRGFDYADANVLEFVQANDWPLLLAKTNPSRSTAEKNKNKYSPLYVMCFYLDFDGAKFDTVTEIFVFRPYDGDVDIRSLEAYPLQYYGSKDVSSSPDEDISEPKVEGSPAVNALVERGQKFIDCTAVTHMAYDSLTVGTAREEVSSPQYEAVKIKIHVRERLTKT